MIASNQAQTETDVAEPTGRQLQSTVFREFENAGLAVKASLNGSAPPQQSVTESTEIDVERVIEEFRPTPIRDLGELVDFGLECGVNWVSPREQQPIPVDACPVCGNELARPRFVLSGVGFRIVDCTTCGLGRLHPQPDVELIRQFYPASYYGVTGAKFVPAVEFLVRFVGARRVRALSRGLSEGAKILDVGCGRGVLLSSLADRGFDIHGFEISHEAAAGADERAAIRVAGDLKQAAYPDNYFDQVILWHVLEHLSDPRGTLEEIRRILSPGGRVVVAVPNYGSIQARWAGPAWFHLDPPRHLFHFPVSALRRLLDETGFDCRSEHHFSLRQNPFGWVQSGLNRLTRLPRNGLYALLKSRSDPPKSGRRAERALFKLAYVLGMPVACLMSGFDALVHRGASVCIVAQARCD